MFTKIRQVAAEVTDEALPIPSIDPAEKGKSITRTLLFNKITLVSVGAVVLTFALDAQAVKQQPKQTCTPDQIAVTVPSIHILGIINSLARPFSPTEPNIRDVVAEKVPDVAISAVVKANKLSGPMGVVPGQYGGIRCLSLPKVTQIAQETLVLPQGRTTRSPKTSTSKKSVKHPAPLSRPPHTSAGNVAIGQKMAAEHGWTGQQWTCLYTLWKHESTWNHRSDNPTSDAYGIPQALPGHKMSSAGSDWRTNPATQIKWGLDYIAGRYGNPCTAWNFWWNVAPHRPPFNGHWY